MRKVLSLVFILLVAVASAQFTDGSASKLGTGNLAKLRSFKKMRFLLPTYVPAGYQLKSFAIEEPNDPVTLMWHVRYVNPKTKGEFVLQMCSDGIGDIFFNTPDGDTMQPTGELPFASSAIGKGVIEVYSKGKLREWHMQWVELKQKPMFVSLIGHNMSGSEGQKIVNSLRWLK